MQGVGGISAGAYTLPMTIGGNIMRMREIRGLKQGELGYRAGVSQSQISLWEAEDSKPDAVTLMKLALVLKCRPEEFFRGVEARDYVDIEEQKEIDERDQLRQAKEVESSPSTTSGEEPYVDSEIRDLAARTLDAPTVIDEVIAQLHLVRNAITPREDREAGNHQAVLPSRAGADDRSNARKTGRPGRPRKKRAG